MEESRIECQDCGATLRILTPAEAQRVAANPQNYILWCRSCVAAYEQGELFQ